MFIDLYCERTVPGFWNEPLNALSNIAFVIAAGIAWRDMAKRAFSDLVEKVVIVLAGTIGVGSFLFHTFASRWAERADIVPIWCFGASYAMLLIYRTSAHDPRRFVRLAAMAIVAVAMLLSISRDGGLMSGPADGPLRFNGSLQYAPALSALVVASALAAWHRHPASRHLYAATLLFCIALFFRSIDLIACESTAGIGTHFIWHLSNAAMIGILLQALVRKMPPLSA